MAARRSRKAAPLPPPTLDLSTLTLAEVLTGAMFCDLPASPLQLAICDAADGKEVNDAALCRAHFGVDRLEAFGGPRRIVEVCAGVRGGKSIIAGAATICAAMRADLSALQPHEQARGAIVSSSLDNAQATYRLLRGAVEASALLRALLVGDPSADSFVLRRPHDGRTVELCCVAASAGGSHLRSRWLSSFVLDEVALFGTEGAGSVVNAEEVYRAGRTRLVPGGWGWLVSSPFGPSGLLYDLFLEHYGRPGSTLVCHAPTRALNPLFPQADIDAIRALTPDIAAREYDASWVDPDSQLLPHVHVDAARRAGTDDIEAKAGVSYVVAIDPATRSNAWTLVIGHREHGPRGVRTVVDVARQWQGSSAVPLDPEAVIAEQAALLARYRVTALHSDSWSADALAALYRQRGLALQTWPTTAQDSLSRFDTLRMALGLGLVDLPPSPQLRSDLLAVRKRATSRAVTIVLPKTPDGRHCDYAPALALLHERLSSAPVYQERGEPTDADKARALEADVLARWQAARNAGTRAIDRVGRKPGALSRFR